MKVLEIGLVLALQLVLALLLAIALGLAIWLSLGLALQPALHAGAGDRFIARATNGVTTGAWVSTTVSDGVGVAIRLSSPTSPSALWHAGSCHWERLNPECDLSGCTRTVFLWRFLHISKQSDQNPTTSGRIHPTFMKPAVDSSHPEPVCGGTLMSEL